MSVKISILLPSRGRTTQLEKSLHSLFDCADSLANLEIIFGFDNDDVDALEYFTSTIGPYIESKNICHKIVVFEPMGYHQLHLYLNSLAAHANGSWFFFWNDDALMQTPGWDTEILKYQNQFKLLSVYTHNDHPYSIFPIIPRQWFDTLGHISQHSLNDAWVSNIAYLLDIFERIPVHCDHDRHDLTGNNNDQTYHNRTVLEGNPDNPGDFNHPDTYQLRLNDCAKLATWMQDQGLDLSFFVRCCQGLQDPWVKLRLNDTNNQVSSMAAV